jgi:hypothetical protein
MKKFLPFHQIKEQADLAIVDALASHGHVFSHWRGAPRLPGLHDDTSTGIVLKALKADHPGTQAQWVSNNHFDVDGFLGIWSLFEPVLALRYEPVLKQAALIGDFREYDPSHPAADHALKVVCWLNAEEKKRFYEPFGAKDEARACVPKYEYFLPRFAAVLEEPDRHWDVLGEEFGRVKRDLERVERAYLVPDIRLWIVEAREPLHYYALFSRSQEADMVLGLYGDQRYELEYKYTTWVDTETRWSYPRLALEALVARLQAQEFGPHQWRGDRIMDTGPMLRLGEPLPKNERYAHPFAREIFSSSIDPFTFKANLLAFFRMAYADLQPQQYWTWQEMREPQKKP